MILSLSLCLSLWVVLSWELGYLHCPDAIVWTKLGQKVWSIPDAGNQKMIWLHPFAAAVGNVAPWRHHNVVVDNSCLGYTAHPGHSRLAELTIP